MPWDISRCAMASTAEVLTSILQMPEDLLAIMNPLTAALMWFVLLVQPGTQVDDRSLSRSCFGGILTPEEWRGNYLQAKDFEDEFCIGATLWCVPCSISGVCTGGSNLQKKRGFRHFTDVFLVSSANFPSFKSFGSNMWLKTTWPPIAFHIQTSLAFGRQSWDVTSSE